MSCILYSIIMHLRLLSSMILNFLVIFCRASFCWDIFRNWSVLCPKVPVIKAYLLKKSMFLESTALVRPCLNSLKGFLGKQERVKCVIFTTKVSLWLYPNTLQAREFLQDTTVGLNNGPLYHVWSIWKNDPTWWFVWRASFNWMPCHKTLPKNPKFYTIRSEGWDGFSHNLKVGWSWELLAFILLGENSYTWPNQLLWVPYPISLFFPVKPV